LTDESFEHLLPSYNIAYEMKWRKMTRANDPA